MKNQLLIIFSVFMTYACNQASKQHIPNTILGKWELSKIYTEKNIYCEPCNQHYIFDECNKDAAYQACDLTIEYLNGSTHTSHYKLNISHDSLWIDGIPSKIIGFNKNEMTLFLPHSSAYQKFKKID